MAYQLSYVLGLDTTGITDLRAQLFDSAGSNVGSAVSTGFVEIGDGHGMYYYLWTGNIDASHQGGIKFYRLSTSSVIEKAAAINPTELENADAKSSTLATQTSVNTIDDLLDTEIAAIQSALSSLATKVAAIRAGVVGRSVADDANDPTEIDYYAEDDTTVLFTHTLTDTERTVA